MTTQLSLVLGASALNQHLLLAGFIDWSKSRWLHIVVCVCVWGVHVHTCTCTMYVCACRGQRTTSIFPQRLLTLFFETGTLTDLQLAEWTRLDGL